MKKRLFLFNNVKIFGIMVVLFFLNACKYNATTRIKDVSNSDGKFKQEENVTWFMNMLANDGNELKTVREIVTDGNEVSVNISIIYDNNTLGDVGVEFLCILLVDNHIIPFRTNDQNMDTGQYILCQNGIEKVVEIHFQPLGVNENIGSLMFLGIPYYNNENTRNVIDNQLIYCKKFIRSTGSQKEIPEMNIYQNYVSTEDTVECFGKKLYEISPFNGSLKDYIIQQPDGSIYYMGDYEQSEGFTILFLDGRPMNEKENFYGIQWKNDKRFIIVPLEMEKIEKGTHTMFAVTIRENETILARKSFNTSIELS